MALTVDDVFEYLGIEAEYADETQKRRATNALTASKMWLVGAVGKRRDLEDPYAWLEWSLAKETMLMACGEMYENRNLVDLNLSKYAGSKAAASLNRLAFDAITQLKYCDYSELSFENESKEPEESSEDSDLPSIEGGDGECLSETQ